jgi:hypothetical protein
MLVFILQQPQAGCGARECTGCAYYCLPLRCMCCVLLCASSGTTCPLRGTLLIRCIVDCSTKVDATIVTESIAVRHHGWDLFLTLHRCTSNHQSSTLLSEVCMHTARSCMRIIGFWFRELYQDLLHCMLLDLGSGVLVFGEFISGCVALHAIGFGFWKSVRIGCTLHAI